MASNSNTNSAGLDDTTQGSTPRQSMIQMWIDNLVKAAVNLAEGDKNLKRNKDDGPTILRDWVDNVVDHEISQAATPLNESEQEGVRIQVYDAVRKSISNLPGSSSKSSKKNRSRQSRKTMGMSSGSSSVHSQRGRKRKRYGGKRRKNFAISKNSSPNSSTSDSDAPNSTGYRGRKKKRILKSHRPPSPITSSRPESPSDTESSFTKYPSHLTKTIPFQPKKPIRSSPKNSAKSQTRRPLHDSSGREDVPDEPRLHVDTASRTAEQNEGSIPTSINGRNSSLVTLDPEMDRAYIYPVERNFAAASNEISANAESDVPHDGRHPPFSPTFQITTHGDKDQRRGMFTSTPIGGNRGVGSTAGRSTQVPGGGLIDPTIDPNSVEAQRGSAPRSSNMTSVSSNYSGPAFQNIPRRTVIIIENIDEWKKSLEYYPLPNSTMKRPLVPPKCQPPQPCRSETNNNDDNRQCISHLHYCPRRGFHSCQGSSTCSLNSWEFPEERQNQQHSSASVINICPSLCQRYLCNYHRN